MGFLYKTINLLVTFKMNGGMMPHRKNRHLFSGHSTGVQAASVDNLVSSWFSYLNFNNITFLGSNSAALPFQWNNIGFEAVISCSRE
jgi:hypothetical protein